jgi:hypothetical protein
MTKRNKLILGVAVVLVAYYLYDRNKKMKAVSEMKTLANEEVEEISLQLPSSNGGQSPTIKKTGATMVKVSDVI